MVLVIDAQQCYNLTGSESSDTSDGRNLMPEPTQNADPAVTVTDSENSQTADTIDSASTDNSNTCEKSADPVGQLAVPFRKAADTVERFVTALLCDGKLPDPQA